ncbi:MAG TPA: hypothetical protein VKS25_13515 [Solirubrobacteraceae bacterium]|nr:hypothetical protein [Solirubrobacteraceae bacterium]
MRPLFNPNVRIRPASEDDTSRLNRLAELDSTSVPPGRLIVAEVDGELLAARQVDGPLAIADPFHPTADLLALLALRGGQLAGRSPRQRRHASRSRRTRLIEARPR